MPYTQTLTKENQIDVTQEYSPGGHGGMDVVCLDSAHALYSPVAGTIVWAQVWNGDTSPGGNMSWGNLILIEFAYNQYILLAHLAEQTWTEGQTIQKGQYVGAQGNTGYSFGIHTHIEYWNGGQSSRYRQDPSPIIGIPNQVGYWDVVWGGKPPLPEAQWHAKELYGYNRESQEAKENAIMIYSILCGHFGWTLNAVAAVLGNIEWESGYNPWRWGYDEPLPSTDYHREGIGYGLVQFTPPQKYIDDPLAKSSPGYAPHFSDVSGSPDDGTAQMYFMSEATNLWYPVYPYNMDYETFKHSTDSVAYLTSVFLDTYERPADPEATRWDRQQAAQYWYNYLAQYDPGTPPTPAGGRKKMPLWMMCQPIFRRRRY